LAPAGPQYLNFVSGTFDGVSFRGRLNNLGTAFLGDFHRFQNSPDRPTAVTISSHPVAIPFMRAVFPIEAPTGRATGLRGPFSNQHVAQGIMEQPGHKWRAITVSSMTQLHRDLELEIEADGDAVIARLSGSAGFQQVAELERYAKAIAAQEAALVVLELSQLNFIASVALGALLALKRTIETRSGKLLLAGLKPSIAAVFRVTGLDTIFEIRASAS
jgi:anti-anti-sigma factor